MPNTVAIPRRFSSCSRTESIFQCKQTEVQFNPENKSANREPGDESLQLHFHQTHREGSHSQKTSVSCSLLLWKLVAQLLLRSSPSFNTWILLYYNMEVASPLTFQPAGTKRSFMCGSPPPMDVSDDYVVQQSKRRRFGDTSPLGFAPSFGASMHTSPFAARALGGKSSSKQIGGFCFRTPSDLVWLYIHVM